MQMNMRALPLLGGILLTAACTAQSADMPLVGADKDAHDCIGSAGYSWSILKQECVQPFSVADIRLTDPDNATLAVYVILSADKSQAELFAADLPPGTRLQAVKGGYLSDDGNIRLLKTRQGWTLKK
ncbi:MULTISPECIES: hypothetical protein [Pasteurellaceae]|uniref:hypothetical protein n=1 Tax=Pasteurellaceae TaxID=712 RepID=UPI00356AF9BC